MANPLVAAPVEMTTPFSGAFLIEDGVALADAIKSGNWVDGGIAAFATALDTVAAISDPIGTLIANGLGWVLDHIEPLKGWLNDFTGDAGAVAGFAQTWRNVSTQMHDAGDAFSRRVDDLDDMSGKTVDAYRMYAGDAAKHLRAQGDWADAVAQGMDCASQLVKIVHDLVRDAISQVVGTAISVAAEMALTLGLATPLAIEQISAKVSALAAKVGRSVKTLLTAFRNLDGLLSDLLRLCKGFASKVDGMLHAKPAPVHPTPMNPKPQKPSARKDKPDGPDRSAWLDDGRPYRDSRPSYRAGVVEEVWRRAVERAWETPPFDGKVRNPYPPHDVIEWSPGDPRKGVWDMGHIPGEKYSIVHDRYMRGEMTREEFLDWYNAPENYLPETPRSNRSGKNE